MAWQTWIGGTSTAFDTGTNWASGTAPGNGDSWVMSKDAVRSIEGNLDQSGDDYQKIIIEEGCTKNLGTGTGAGMFLCACGEFIHNGSGSAYLKAAHATADIDEIIVNSPRLYIEGGSAALTLDDDGTAENIRVKVLRGWCAFSSDATGTAAKVYVDGSRAALTTQTATGTFTRLVVSNGWAYTQNALTNVHVHGGHLIVADGAVGTILTVSGGRCDYNSDDTLPWALVTGGLLDFDNDMRNKTVTLLETTPGGRYRAGNHITFTTENAIGGTKVQSYGV